MGVRSIAIAGTLLLAASMPDRAGAEIGTCELSKATFRTEDRSDFTTSASFVNVPRSRVRFTTSAAGCVIVTFSAVSLSVGGTIVVRPLLDGATIASPPLVLWHSDENRDDELRSVGVRSFQFVFRTVAAGVHTIVIQWGSAGGEEISLDRRTIVVQYGE